MTCDMLPPALWLAALMSLAGPATGATDTPGAPWQVGYAEADMTPAPGQAMMAGFGRERYPQGAIAPLRAQALALRDANGKTALLVVADVLGFGRVSVNAMR